MKPCILITGAAGGLGSAFAVECARRGYSLLLTDLRPECADLAAYLIASFGVEAQYRPCDLSSQAARTVFYESLKTNGISFWGLINVAGLDFEGSFLERSRQQVLHIIHLNVESTLDTSYSILKLRDPSQRFRMINVCSLAAFYPMPYKAVYAASKRFLLDFSRALGEEIAEFGSVTALCPAGLPTTPETIRAIFAQGFWGQVTTLSTRTVARQTLDRALKGRKVFIPGFINQVIQSLGGVVPAWLVVHFVSKRWRAAQNEQQDWYPRQAANFLQNKA